MPLKFNQPKGFDNYGYLISVERSGLKSIDEQLRILKNVYCKSKYYKGTEKIRLDYQVEYLEYLKFWHTK